MAEPWFEPARIIAANPVGQPDARRSPVVAAPEPPIRPGLPFVFAFAVPDSPTRMATIIPGAITKIEVSGAPNACDPGDWFGARVPAVPQITGPIAVAGVFPEDIIEIEVLDLEPLGRRVPAPLLVTVAVAPREAEDGVVQAAIPAGGLTRLPVRRPGGLLSFGPVHAGRHADRVNGPTPVPARLSVRLTVARPRGAQRTR